MGMGLIWTSDRCYDRRDAQPISTGIGSSDVKLLSKSFRPITQQILLWGWVVAIGLWLSSSTLCDGPRFGGDNNQYSQQSVSPDRQNWNQFNPSFDAKERLKGITQGLPRSQATRNPATRNPATREPATHRQEQELSSNTSIEPPFSRSQVEMVDYTRGHERITLENPPNGASEPTGFPQNGPPLGKVDSGSILPTDVGKSDDHADQVGAAGEVIGFSHSDGSGTLTITLVHTGKSSIAVYHIDRSGEIRLMSSRPIDADFSILLNATSPTPSEIRAVIGKR